MKSRVFFLLTVFCISSSTADEGEEFLLNHTADYKSYVREENLLHSNEPYLDSKKWERGWKRHPLFIIILGGLRWDFLNNRQDALSSFEYLRKHGTVFNKVTPVFPPEDLPVWTSIATGLYPNDNNIVGDIMFDLKSRNVFNRSQTYTADLHTWWKSVVPVWNIALKHGRKVALYNWHAACKSSGANQTEGAKSKVTCVPFQRRDKIAKQAIVRQFNEASTLIHSKDYDLAIVYTDAIQRVVERYGSKSLELDNVLNDIDDILQDKLTDIISKNERSGRKINLMILSDYGMKDLDDTISLIDLNSHFNMSNIQYIIHSSGYASIIPYSLKHEKILEECRRIDGAHCYLTSLFQKPPLSSSHIFPQRYHYGNNSHIPDIVILAEPAYAFTSSFASSKILKVSMSHLKAGSGWDPQPLPPPFSPLGKGKKMSKASSDWNATLVRFNDYHKYKDDMKTTGFALGPDFKKKYRLTNPIETVDFYQIFCFLLQIPPEKHSGNWARVESMLTISCSTQITSNFSIIIVLFYIYQQFFEF